jgi:hypothetical protein
MAGKTKPPPTAWEASDELWGRAEPALAAAYPPKPAGRPRVDFRPVLDGVIFRLRSGVQWSEPPERFGDDGGGHRWFQRWRGDGVPAEDPGDAGRGPPGTGGGGPGAAGREWRAGSGGPGVAGGRRPAGQSPARGARSARTRPTAAKTARNRASSSKPTAARSPR